MSQAVPVRFKSCIFYTFLGAHHQQKAVQSIKVKPFHFKMYSSKLNHFRTAKVDTKGVKTGGEVL